MLPLHLNNRVGYKNKYLELNETFSFRDSVTESSPDCPVMYCTIQAAFHAETHLTDSPVLRLMAHITMPLKILFWYQTF